MDLAFLALLHVGQGPPSPIDYLLGVMFTLAALVVTGLLVSWRLDGVTARPDAGPPADHRESDR